MKHLTVTQGKLKGDFIKVDDEDYPLLSRFIWRIQRVKRENLFGEIMEYTKVARSVLRRTIFLEYFIIPMDTATVLHKNGDIFDFRKSNLILQRKDRRVHGDRKHFLKKDSKFSTTYKGVICRADTEKKCFQARITFDKKRIHLGTFDTAEKAAIAYNKKAKELYGDFAYQNKIID